MTYPVNYIGISQNYHSGQAIDFGWNRNFGGQTQPIYAIDNGKVIYRAKQTAGGNVLRIKHDNGYVSEYAHLNNKDLVLKFGNKVKKGQQIALMGNTGTNQTGYHLHFCLYKSSKISASNCLPCLEYLLVGENQTVGSGTAKKYDLIKYGQTYECTATALNVRNKPGLFGRITGRLYKGNEVKIYDIVKGWYRTSPSIQRWSASKYLERK